MPVFTLVTPAHWHDSQIGWLITLVLAILYSFQVLVVYAEAAYFAWIKRYFGLNFFQCYTLG